MANVCRFVIQAPDGRRSAEWRVWTGKEKGKPKDDVYLAPASQAIDSKISLHPANWYGQHGLSDVVRKQVRPGDRHAIARWDLTPTDLFPGWQTWYALQFPESELVNVPLTSASPQEVVEPPGQGMSLQVLVVVGDPGASIPADVAPFVIGFLDRGNGGQVALIGVETDFDGSIIENVAGGAFGAPWEVPGLQALREPFGWVVDVGLDGTRRSTEFDGSALEDRRAEAFSLPSFPGRLRPWSEKPGELNDRGLMCAVLIVPERADAELFVDFRARCDHSHLSEDARKLVEAVRRGDVDHGWDQLPNGDWATGIAVARVMSELGGLDDGDWAVGPEDNDDPGV